MGNAIVDFKADDASPKDKIKALCEQNWDKAFEFGQREDVKTILLDKDFPKDSGDVESWLANEITDKKASRLVNLFVKS